METKTKHTPGPWRIGNNGFNACQICAGQENPLEYEGVASVDGIPIHWTTGEAFADKGQRTQQGVANAHIIAAAPELLEALGIMTALCKIKYGNLDKDIYAEILKAESAIAKATGGDK